MNIAILTGSNHAQSTGTRLCRYMQKLLEAKGCTVRLVDLYQEPVPFYSPDMDYTEDSRVVSMQSALRKADAIIVCTPEYHGSISGVLKNALDHMGSDEFGDKPVLSVSSSGGAVGVSSLLQLQAIIRNLHGINCPEWISIGGEQRSFNEQGEPLSPKLRNRIEHALHYFMDMTERMRPHDDGKTV
jgi:NAD(P)H-dependent FMN reductase